MTWQRVVIHGLANPEQRCNYMGCIFGTYFNLICQI